jgi:hypothetical protein
MFAGYFGIYGAPRFQTWRLVQDFVLEYFMKKHQTKEATLNFE